MTGIMATPEIAESRPSGESSEHDSYPQIRLLVTGSRHWNDLIVLDDTLSAIHESKKIGLLIHGNATGADKLSGAWAKEHGIPVAIYPAQWDFYGKSAGPIRNSWMLDFGQPDLCVAFPMADSRGTWDMVRKVQEAGVDLMIVRG